MKYTGMFIIKSAHFAMCHKFEDILHFLKFAKAELRYAKAAFENLFFDSNNKVKKTFIIIDAIHEEYSN